MGIDAGIKVKRRITNEQQWRKFLQAVVDYFKDDARVCMEVKINFDTGIYENAEPSLTTSPKPATDIRFFHLIEPFNFVAGDFSLSVLWNTRYPVAKEYYYGTMSDKHEAELKEASYARLQSEVVRLNYTDINIEQLVSHSY